MNSSKLFASASTLILGMATITISLAFAAPPKDAKPAEQPQIKLPPGWTEADMQACILAATPGKMQERLAQDVGVWEGKCSIWMPPGGGEPMKTDCKLTVTSIMGGRYIKSEMAGEMPGGGAFAGFGLTGFDNVSRKFVSSMIDNQSTGIMTGTGELSPDGKILAWTYTYSCPVTQKPAVLRQIETNSDSNTKIIESIGADPKSGKEFQMMRIELTRK